MHESGRGCADRRAPVLFALLKRIADQYSTTLALYVFTMVFVFSRLTSIGSYNYLCPYSHEATYGIALSLTATYLMVRYGECGRMGWVVGSGISAGLVSLTKPEIFLALVPAIACGFWRARRYGTRRVISTVWVGTML
jgi:4-amino-4-deoxy-L-arabinose transferase-like glycosyltransferase